MTSGVWQLNREAYRTISVYGNVDEPVMTLKVGKYLAVAMEEWHERKKETVRKEKKKEKKHMDYLLH